MAEAIGIPEAMLREATQHAVCKINVATDLRVAYAGTLRKTMYESPEKFDFRFLVEPSLKAVSELVADKMKNVLGSAGQVK